MAKGVIRQKKNAWRDETKVQRDDYTFYYAFQYLLNHSLDLKKVNDSLGIAKREGIVYCDVDKEAITVDAKDGTAVCG